MDISSSELTADPSRGGDVLMRIDRLEALEQAMSMREMKMAAQTVERAREFMVISLALFAGSAVFGVLIMAEQRNWLPARALALGSPIWWIAVGMLLASGLGVLIDIASKLASQRASRRRFEVSPALIPAE